MIRLASDADYHARRRELIALDEITDDCVQVVQKARRHGELRPDLADALERFAETLMNVLDAHLDRPLVVRREAVLLYEEMLANRGTAPARLGLPNVEPMRADEAIAPTVPRAGGRNPACVPHSTTGGNPQ